MIMKAKISVIGAGFVGSTAAYTLLVNGLASEIALIDINGERAEGEALDMMHGMQFLRRAKVIYGSDYELCRDSDITVICAGAHQQTGETRLDLAAKNAKIFKSMVPEIARRNRGGIILVVANPVDVLTYLTLKYSGFSPDRVFGTGTALDTARFRFLLGEHFHVNPNSVHAYVLGEHGDSEFPVWSSANIAGVRLREMDGYGRKQMDGIFEKTRDAAYEVISKKGATYYSISLVISKIVRSLLSDSHDVMPVSTLLKGYYGISDVCLSVPSVLCRTGIDRRLVVPLDEAEKRKLKNLPASSKLP
jgi:L-lactate dehydrogenase